MSTNAKSVDVTAVFPDAPISSNVHVWKPRIPFIALRPATMLASATMAAGLVLGLAAAWTDPIPLGRMHSRRGAALLEMIITMTSHHASKLDRWFWLGVISLVLMAVPAVLIMMLIHQTMGSRTQDELDSEAWCASRGFVPIDASGPFPEQTELGMMMGTTEFAWVARGRIRDGREVIVGRTRRSTRRFRRRKSIGGVVFLYHASQIVNRAEIPASRCTNFNSPMEIGPSGIREQFVPDEDRATRSYDFSVAHTPKHGMWRRIFDRDFLNGLATEFEACWVQSGGGFLFTCDGPSGSQRVYVLTTDTMCRSAGYVIDQYEDTMRRIPVPRTLRDYRAA